MKALIFFTVLFIFTVGGVYLFSDPESRAQIPPAPLKKPIKNIEKEFDARLDRVEDKVTQAEQLPAKPVVKIIYRTKNVAVPHPKEETIYFMRDSTVSVEMNVRRESGAFFVDMNEVDSIEKAQDDLTVKPYYDVRDTVVEQAEEHIKFWERVTRIFKRKN